MQTGKKCSIGIPYEQEKWVYMTPLEEFYGPFTELECAVCQDEKCGHVSEGIITGVEEMAMGSMIQPDAYWEDSKTLMCSWKGQGKRWRDLVSSAVHLV